MKKTFLVLFFLMATFLLSSCDKVAEVTDLSDVTTTGQTTVTDSTEVTTTEVVTTTQQETVTELSDETIIEQIEALINARSFEARMNFRVKTDEMELSVNPLLSFQKYTDDNEKEVYRIHYYNKIMEGTGLEAYEFIVDERDEAIYINNTHTWFKGTFDEFEEETGNPIFGYLFDLDNQIDDEMKTDIETIQEILLDGIQNFNSATFIDIVEDDSRQLIHYELEYNVYNMLEEIFDYYNAKDEPEEYEDFEDFLNDIDIADILDIFKQFTIDVYFDIEDNSLVRIELDLINIFDNDILLDKIEEAIDDEDIDIHTIFAYFNDFEIGINIYDINTLAEITVPDEAKSGYSLDLLDAQFNPEDLIEINVGDTVQINLADEDEIWYTFTIIEAQNINITTTPDVGYYAYNTLYDSDFDYLSNYTNLNNVKTYNNLSAGTYYLEIYGNSGNVELTID